MSELSTYQLAYATIKPVIDGLHAQLRELRRVLSEAFATRANVIAWDVKENVELLRGHFLKLCDPTTPEGSSTSPNGKVDQLRVRVRCLELLKSELACVISRDDWCPRVDHTTGLFDALRELRDLATYCRQHPRLSAETQRIAKETYEDMAEKVHIGTESDATLVDYCHEAAAEVAALLARR